MNLGASKRIIYLTNGTCHLPDSLLSYQIYSSICTAQKIMAFADGYTLSIRTFFPIWSTVLHMIAQITTVVFWNFSSLTLLLPALGLMTCSLAITTSKHFDYCTCWQAAQVCKKRLQALPIHLSRKEWFGGHSTVAFLTNWAEIPSAENPLIVKYLIHSFALYPLHPPSSGLLLHAHDIHE